ncbi:hypothetical protein D3C75_1366430 [compost metagenome]
MDIGGIKSVAETPGLKTGFVCAAYLCDGCYSGEAGVNPVVGQKCDFAPGYCILPLLQLVPFNSECQRKNLL